MLVSFSSPSVQCFCTPSSPVSPASFGCLTFTTSVVFPCALRPPSRAGRQELRPVSSPLYSPILLETWISVSPVTSGMVLTKTTSSLPTSVEPPPLPYSPSVLYFVLLLRKFLQSTFLLFSSSLVPTKMSNLRHLGLRIIYD